MLQEIKEELLKNPEAIEELLTYFGFEHIKTSRRDIRFARDSSGGRNISIRLDNNEALYVNDFARGVSADIFQYIIQEKNATFREVLQQVKKILGLTDDWRPRPKYKALFGGIYQNISCKNREIRLPTYDDSILSQYERIGNSRFLRDGISLEAQQFWDIRFSVEDDAIVIPIRNEFGDLVGIKSRINRDPEDGESKYYYALPVQMSQVLYGYNDNYQYLYGNDVILVESEKSVMQAWDFGVRNVLALGSNNLSEKQTRLLFQLQPKRIILAMDEGLPLEQTQKNANTIKTFGSMMMPEIWYWDWTQNLDINHKDSITDNGYKMFKEIMDEQLERMY